MGVSVKIEKDCSPLKLYRVHLETFNLFSVVPELLQIAHKLTRFFWGCSVEFPKLDELEYVKRNLFIGGTS